MNSEKSQRDKKSIRNTLVVGGLLIAAFVVYYFMYATPRPLEHPTLISAEQSVVLSPQVGLGQQLTSTYCADCHATGPSGESPNPSAPHFRDLHQRYDVALLSEALVEGLYTHPDMPEFEFDPEQAEAIISYIKTLQSE